MDYPITLSRGESTTVLTMTGTFPATITEKHDDDIVCVFISHRLEDAEGRVTAWLARLKKDGWKVA
jgi:hypothetical protein